MCGRRRRGTGPSGSNSSACYGSQQEGSPVSGKSTTSSLRHRNSFLTLCPQHGLVLFGDHHSLMMCRLSGADAWEFNFGEQVRVAGPSQHTLLYSRKDSLPGPPHLADGTARVPYMLPCTDVKTAMLPLMFQIQPG